MSKPISYIYKNGKYIFCKDDIYFALSTEQMRELTGLFNDILIKEEEKKQSNRASA